MKSAVFSGSAGLRNGMSQLGPVLAARCVPDDTEHETTLYGTAANMYGPTYAGSNGTHLMDYKEMARYYHPSTPCQGQPAELDHGKQSVSGSSGRGAGVSQPYATRGACSNAQMQHNPPHGVGMFSTQAASGWDASVSQSNGMGTYSPLSAGMQSSHQQLAYSRPSTHSASYLGSHSSHLPGTMLPSAGSTSVHPSAYFAAHSSHSHHQYPPSLYHLSSSHSSVSKTGVLSQPHAAGVYPPSSCSGSTTGSNLSMHYPSITAPSWDREPYSSSSSSTYSEHSLVPFEGNLAPYPREMAGSSRYGLQQPQPFGSQYESQSQRQRAPQAQASPYHYPPLQHASQHSSSHSSSSQRLPSPLPSSHSALPCASSYSSTDPYHPPAHASSDPYHPVNSSLHPYEMPAELMKSYPGSFSKPSSEVRVPPSYLPLGQEVWKASLTRQNPHLPSLPAQVPDSSTVESCGRLPQSLDERVKENAREGPSGVTTSEVREEVAENMSRAQNQQQQKERGLQELESPGQYIEIICHPEDTQVVEGSSVTLTCSARILENSGKPSYLWYKDEEPLIGEVEGTYTIAAVTSDDVGYYFCVVSDTEGQVERKSRTACISLVHEVSATAERCPPFILEQPDSIIQVVAGGMLSLKLKVRAHPPPTFVWYRNGIELPFAQDEELVVPRVSTRDEGQYTCSISNELGSTLSGRFTVQLVKRPSYPELSATALEAASNSTTIPDSNFAPPTYSTDLNAHKSSPLPSPIHHIPPTSRRRSAAFYHATPPPLPPTNEGLRNVPTDHGSTRDRSMGLMASQLAHCSEPSISSRLAMELNISSEELGRVRAQNPHLEQQLLHLLMIGCERTMCRDVGQLEKLLQHKGFRVSLPHSSFVPFTTPSQRELSSTAGSSIGPVIITHPRSVQVHAGEPAMLSVEVSMADTDVTTYRWYKDGLFLYDECQPHLLLQVTHESDSGVYYCKVEGRLGTADSHPARVEVLPASTFFSGTVTSEYPSYQPTHGLTRDDLIYDVFREPYIPRKESGDTSSLPSLDSMPISHPQGYIEPAYTSRGHVTNSTAYTVPSITEQLQNSRISDVSSKQKPVILKHPQSQELNLGDELKLSVQASGSGELKYLWHLNNISLYNECRPEFVLYCFTEEDEGNYMCEVSNDSGSVLSHIASISCKQDDTSDAED